MAEKSVAKRKWEEDHNRSSNKDIKVAGGDEDSDIIGHKRKVYILFQYLGTGYSGLQIQFGRPDKTIENELFLAIHKAGGITAKNMDSIRKIKWVRAARTDKGVHAAGNCLSLMMIMPQDQRKANQTNQSAENMGDSDNTDNCASKTESEWTSEMIARINDNLPPTIRCITYTRCMNSFHAKYSCTSRSYEYILPSYALSKQFAELSAEQLISNSKRFLSNAEAAEQQLKSKNKSQKAAVGEDDSDREEEEDDEEEIKIESKDSPLDSATLEGLRSYRISFAEKQRVNSILSNYVGVKNFFNFTRFKEVKNREDKIKANQSNQQQQSNNANFSKQGKNKQGDNNNDSESAASSFQALFSRATFTRHIKSFSIISVFEREGLEFVQLRVQGASFLYNQIRKMVALLILINREVLKESNVFPAIFQCSKLTLPLAPSLGLYLDKTYFEGYDQRCGQANNQGEKRKSVAEAFEENSATIAQFKENVIIPQICSVESKDFEFYSWLSNLYAHSSLLDLGSTQQQQQQ
jgi:tRNA pseudouridine38-40 synthase